MFQIDDALLSRFSLLDVHDPRDMAGDSRISQRLRQGETANTYRLRDAALWSGRPGPLLTRLAGRPLGPLHLAFNTDRYGTEVEVRGPGMPRQCLSLMLSGGAASILGAETVTISRTRGAVLRGEPGTRLMTTDRSARLNLWVSDALLARMLQSLLQDEPLAPLRFRPELNWTSPAGASLLRMMAHLLDELRDPDGIAGSETALATFADLLADTMLRRLPHSHTEALQRGRTAAAIPRQLRRAEAFMEAAADRPLTLAEIAEAAGCSLRALHEAFRRFRDTTPHAALQAMRLERARAALRSEPDMAAGAIARQFGFTNATRFAAAYARRFGETPAETRRRR